MAKSLTFDNDFLKLIFQATAIANIADNASSSPLTNLYVTMHTADPLAGGLSVQTTSEVSYSGYARIAVARSASGFTVTNNTVTLKNDLTFASPASGTYIITHWSIGTASAGAGKILYSGSVSPIITITAGGTPVILATSNVSES